MTEDWQQLENEINAEMAAWSAALDVAIPRDVVGRARLATRVALDERVLAEAQTPAMPAGLRRRLRALIRRELVQPGSVAPGARRGYGRALSALGAAAMLAVCVGIIQQAGRWAMRPADAAFEQFVAAGSAVYESDPLTTGLSEELQDLEESITQWSTDTDRVEEGLQQLEEMMDKTL